jgi:Xaa-Pro aminopeptidase
MKSADEGYPFTVDKNFYYLTGLDMPNAAVFVSARGSKLFLPPFDPKREIYEGPQPSFRSMCETAGFPEEDAAEGIPEESLLDQLPVIRELWLDILRPQVPCYHAPSHRMAARAESAGIPVQNVYRKIYSLRRVKDAGEIGKLRRAVDVVGESLDFMAQTCRAGMPENQWQAAFEYAMRQRGCEPSFPSIVAGGKNAVFLHYTKNNAPVNRGEMLLMDVGAYFDHYASDISRTFPVGGFTQRQRDIYQLVYDVTRVNLEHMKPGKPYQDHVDAMCAYFAKYLKPLRIAITEIEQENFLKGLSRGVCHHMGLDAHDGYAAPDEILLPGMVFTNEPGVYLKEEGIGVRIEEDLLITETGNELLSKNIPSAAADVEHYLK